MSLDFMCGRPVHVDFRTAQAVVDLRPRRRMTSPRHPGSAVLISTPVIAGQPIWARTAGNRPDLGAEEVGIRDRSRPQRLVGATVGATGRIRDRVTAPAGAHRSRGMTW